MTTSELVAKAYLKAAGKVSSLTSTDTKYIKLLAIANTLIGTWQNEPNVDWNSLYDPDLALVDLITATNTYAIPATVRKLSDARGDYVRVHWTDGVNYTDFNVVTADTLKRYDTTANVCAQIGSNLVFARTFASTDPEFGGTIKLPVYTFAPTLVESAPTTGQTTTVPVDIPEWLVIMTAAEYVRNDVTKQSQYPNLVNEANQLMQRMKDDNEAQISEVHIPFSAAGADW